MINTNEDYILTIEDLETNFIVGRRTVKAVNGVSFNVRRGKTLGLVGESGCGKSVTAHSIMMLLPKAGKIVKGKIIFHQESDKEIDIISLKKNGKEIRNIRGNKISMIFQDPMSSLNPVYTIGSQVCESILQHRKMSKKEALVEVEKMLLQLGIPMAGSRMKDYPHQFSGGMKQRVMIAMGMINSPKLLIADEPTTALDVTIQAQILELMKKMQNEYGTTIIIITHNMGVVADMADNIAVMYMGKIVEFGSREQIFLETRHPYTTALLKSVPVLGLGLDERLLPIRGNTPDPSEMPEGCAFAPRCDFTSEKCKETPPTIDVGEGHKVQCWNCEGGCIDG